jgi:hypothetical protein
LSTVSGYGGDAGQGWRSWTVTNRRVFDGLAVDALVEQAQDLGGTESRSVGTTAAPGEVTCSLGVSTVGQHGDDCLSDH